MSTAELIQFCRERAITLATAESCTGGLIGAELTAVPGSSDIYLGGVIAYSNSLKEHLLRVPLQILGSVGAVSKESALAMANGVCQVTGARAGVAVTGIAGPGGGTDEKPVGLVYVAAAFNGRAVVTKHLFPGDRAAVRTETLRAALDLLANVLRTA